jgi:trimeric autotransporter adhesin
VAGASLEGAEAMRGQRVVRTGRLGLWVTGVAAVSVVMVVAGVAGGGRAGAAAGGQGVAAAGGQAAAGAGGRGWRAGSAAGVISVVAGGVGGPGRGNEVDLRRPCGVSFAGGMVYVADGSLVRRVDPRTGWLDTLAGSGYTPNHIAPLGDGGPAGGASLNDACGATADRSGDLVIADTGDNRVRVVARRTGRLWGQPVTAGDIYTVAGSGRAGFSGDGQRAREAELNRPWSVVVDGAGNLVIADTGNNRIRVVARRSGTFYGQAMTAGDIYTVAGDGGRGYNGDGIPATSAELNDPHTVAIDGAGNLVIADTGNNRIRVVAESTGTFYGQAMTAGDIYTVAGDGVPRFAGDGGPATVAAVHGPQGMAFDRAGNLVIAATSNQRIRVVAARTGTFYGQAMTAGDIYTVAGDGSAGLSGDGEPATEAQLYYPGGVAVDGAGNLVITDRYHNQLRVVAASTGKFYGQAMTAGDIYTVAGTSDEYLSGLGGPATTAEFLPRSMDPQVTGSPTYPGVGDAITDNAGNTVFDTPASPRVLVVPRTSGTFYGRAMTAGHIYSIAGNGGIGFAGDGDLAGKAEFAFPSGLAVDRFGNVLLADSQNQRVRAIAEQTGTFYGVAMKAGHVYTIAGDGNCGNSGDGGRATRAELCLTTDVAVDAAGNVLISQAGYPAIRVVPDTSGSYYGQAMTAGDIYTIAGSGGSGYYGDGGPATSAELDFPEGVAVDGLGNVLIADTENNRIRVVAASTGTFYGQAMIAGDIYTVAGDGNAGYSGDGGPATGAGISDPSEATVDSAGNLLIADSGNHRVRVVAESTGTFYGVAMTAGDIYTIGGGATPGCTGNGGPATSAGTGGPQSVAVNAAGDVLFADGNCNEIRQITG